MTDPRSSGPIPKKAVVRIVVALAVIGVAIWGWVISTETPVIPNEPVDTSGNGLLLLWILAATEVGGFFLVTAAAAVAARIVAARRARR